MTCLILNVDPLVSVQSAEIVNTDSTILLNENHRESFYPLSSESPKRNPSKKKYSRPSNKTPPNLDIRNLSSITEPVQLEAKFTIHDLTHTPSHPREQAMKNEMIDLDTVDSWKNNYPLKKIMSTP